MAAKATVAAVFVGVVLAVLVHCGTAQTFHVVGDGLGWTIPQGGAGAYANWAASKTFMVGDILVFNFVTGQHDVLEVPKASFDSCSSANPIGSLITSGPANITLTTAGDHYYICTFSQHCSLGQKLSLTVSSPGATPPPRTAHVVGDGLGWTIVQGGAGAYANWAASKTFLVGDTLVFNFVTGQHDVLEVPKASFDSCSSANPIGSLITSGPANITLTTAGDHYYICTFSQHCSLGQKLSLTVSSPGATPSPRAAPEPIPPPTNNSNPAACPPDSAPSPKAAGGPTAASPGPGTPPPRSSSHAITASFLFPVISIFIGWFM